MGRRGVSGLLLLVCTALAAASAATKCPEKKSGSSPGREIVCYSGTRNHSLLLDNGIVCQCTTIVHQGHDLRSLDASELKSLRDKAREANPDVRVIMSVSDNHGLLKSSASTRQETATHLTDVLKEVDGVELNVTAGSKDRLVSFVKSLKEDMANKSSERMILMSLPTRPELLAKQFELKELSKYVDMFTVATHYLKDAEESYKAFHPSRLMGLFDMLNTDSLVDLISGMGAPKQKILITAPVSAYKFTLKKPEENTPWSSTVEELPTSMDRKQLCEAMNDGEWMVERDEDLTGPYAFKNTTWVAFEDETSLKIKGKYVILRELAGLGLQDIENDLTNNCSSSLAQLMYQSFTDMKRKTRELVLSSLEKDLKESEISYPRHVRSSEFRIVRVVDTEGKIRAVRENTQTAFSCSRQGYFVHPRSCNRFYRCVKFNQEIDDYSVFEFDCPAGLAFDERTEVCSWPGSLSTGSACPGSSEIEPVPRSRFRCPHQPGFYADPQNCRWFFACYDLGGPEMLPYEFRCPFGLVFDQQRLVCEWPWKVPGCDGPGHGSGHSVYTFGGSFGGQDGIPQGGIVGQGGFIGQSGYSPDADNFNSFNQGVNFGANSYNDFGAAQGSNVQGTAYNNAGFNYNGPTYNADGAGSDYDGQVYANAGLGAEYDGQNYNAGDTGAGTYISPNHNAAGPVAYAGQTYNLAGSGAASYPGQTYNAAGSSYPGQTYNAAGSSYPGPSYIASGSGAGSPFSGQTYNTAGAGAAPYAGQTYNTADAVQHFNSVGTPYTEQTYNTAGSGAQYSGQNYNAATGGQTYSNARPEGSFAGQNFNAATTGQTYNTAGSTVQSYQGNKPGVGQTFNSAGISDFRAHDGYHYDKPVKEFNEEPSTLGADAQRFNTNSFNAATTGFATNAVDYEDQRTATSNSPFNGPTNYANGGIKTTNYNAGETTIGVSNLAGDNRGTTGYSTGQTNLAGPTVYNAGTTNDFSSSNTNQFATGGTNGYAAGTTNFNGQNTYTGGVSTIGFGNTAEAFGSQSTLFNDVEGLTVYNASYNPTAGFPSSTILPFTDKQNTFNPNVYNGPNTVNYGGSTLAPANNDITQFRESTNTPDDFRFNGNTGANTQYNTATSFNQNTYTGYATGSTPSPVTGTPQVYNNQGTLVPGVVPLNNARPEIQLDNSGLFRGPSTNYNVPTTQAVGYKTNEYYDNGGGGTIRYNNGVVTNKVTENDIQDYRTSSYTGLPNSFIINAGNGENPQSTIVKTDSTDAQLFTKEGFTKTGPTKTGITTAQVGGSGSYVIGTGYPRARPDPQFIGENAFTGTFGTNGVTNQRPNTVPNYAPSRPANPQYSKPNSGSGGYSYPKPSTGTGGYSYPKPLVQLEINSPFSTPSPSKTNFVSTTPSAISNVQTLDNQNSIIIDSQDEGFSSTISPVGFTTGQREEFKTTVYQAAKVPQVVSTVRPVIDTGSRTVISSTPIPAVYSTPVDNVTPTPKTYLDVGVSFDDYSLSQGSTGYSDYSDVTSNADQGNFGQKIPGQTRVPATSYQQPTTTNLREENQNNAITSTQEDYNTYATGVDSTQTGFVRNDQATNFGPTVTIPKQVYIPSSTVAPVIGVTFGEPTPAFELPQNQPTGFSLNTNTANSASRGTANRIIINQGTSNYAPRPANILVNQAPAGFGYHGSNGVLANQASYSSDQSANQYFNNQASGNFGSRGSNNRIIVNNQVPTNFVRQEQNGVYGNRASISGLSRNQASGSSYSQNQGVGAGQTRTLVGSNVVTSIDLNNEVSRQNGDSLRIITEFNNGNLGRIPSSTTLAPEVTTFNGEYAKTRTQSTFNQNKKVVVKLSDLHPLILNKLGAECTCKSDPFAVFRGPNRQSLPINSQNRGTVDLANYDEKDIYVDVDSSERENAEEIEFARNIPSNRLIKTPGARLRVNDATNVVVSSRGEPSSTFLPPTSPAAFSSYLPPSSTYLPSSTAAPLLRSQASRSQKPLLIRVDDNYNSASIVRSGKSLKGSGTANDLRHKNGPTVAKSGADDSVADGSLQCARPGLFRHPKLCNKFYACHWDEWKKRYTLHIFNCPVHLAFDASAGACNYPSKGPACQDNKLLV